MTETSIPRTALSRDRADRLAVWRRVGALGGPPNEAFDRLARLAQAAASAPIVLISFVDEATQYIAGSLGLPEPWASSRQMPVGYSLCQQVARTGQRVIVEDAQKQASAYADLDPAPLTLGAYAGLPILTMDGGFAGGVVAVIDHKPRNWSLEVLRALEDVAAMAATLISLQANQPKALQQALQHSEERLRLISHATRDIVYEITLATGEIWWSRGLVTLLGYWNTEFEATLEWWQAHIHPDEREKVVEGFRQVLNSDDPFWSKEYRFQRHDGSYAQLFDRGYVIRDAEGHSTHFAGSIADISGYRQTEQDWQESETRFSQLVETADEGVWLLDIDNRTTFVNQRMAEMLGYIREELVGASLLDFLEGQDRLFAETYLIERRQGSRTHSDFRLKRRDGSTLWALMNIGPLLDANGVKVGGYARVSDIKERKQAVEGLGKGYAEIDDLYHNAPCGYHSLARDGTFLRINNTELGWLGYTRDELVGRRQLSDVLTPEAAQQLDDSYSQFVREGGIHQLEVDMVRKTGERFPVLMSSTALYDREGKFVRTRTVVFDLTERKRAEQLVRQSEERFRQLAENIEQVFWITSPTLSELLYVSPAYETIWGRTCQSLYDDPRSFMKAIHPEDREYVMARFPEREVGTYNLEYRILQPNGNMRWVWSRAFPIRDANGVVYRVAGISEDITERRRTEDALAHERDLLQALMDSVPDTIYFKDIASRFTRINQAQTRVLGVENAQMAVGKTDSDYFQTPGLALHLFAQEQEMMRTGQPLIDDIERHVSETGTVRWFSSTKVPIKDRQGRVVGMVGVSRDITERKLAEEEMQAQRDLFENLVAVARATAALPSLEATLQNTLRVSARLTGALRGSLFLLNEASEVTHSIRSEGQEIAQPRVELVGQVMEHGLAGWVVRHKESALLADTRQDDRWLPSPDESYQARSVLAVPIVHTGSLLGLVTLLHPEPNKFSLSHVKLMEAASDQMALALRNARMLDETQRLAEQMYMLNHVTQAALAATTLEDLYQALADRIGELFGSDHGHITYWDEAQQKPLAKASSDPDWRTLEQKPASWAWAEALTTQVVTQGHALPFEDVQQSTTLADEGGAAPPPNVRSALGLPLIAHGRRLGAIILDYETPQHFTETQISLGERVARQVALALSNALLYREATAERGRLQALIDSSRDGVALISLDKQVLICNVPSLRLLGLPGQPADWVGKPIQSALIQLALQAPQVAKAGENEMRRINIGSEPVHEGEYEVDSHYVHWINLPVMGNETALGRLLVFRDVTEEHALEKMRDDLAHMMVHDLHSPLSAIIGATELLARAMKAANSADEELAEIVRDNAQRMLGLVNDILNVSQLEAGQMPLDQKPVALEPLVAEVLQLQENDLTRKKLQVDSLPEGTELPLVWADLRLVVRVLQNLIGNAVKFTPEDGRLQIRAAPEAGWLRVAVTNSGPGIPPEIKSRLFQKFVRGNQREHGSGLGLAFCHLVIEAHGGQIWVESEPEKGATFQFTLPLYQPGN